MSFGFRAKLILLVGLAVLLVGAFSLAYNYIILRAQVISSTQRTVEILAATAALQLRGEDIRELRHPADYAGPEYAAVYDALKRVLIQNADKNFKADNIYVIRQDPDDRTGNRIYFAAHLPGDEAFEYGIGPVSRMADSAVNYIGNDVGYPLRAEMKRIVYEGASATSTDIYEFPPYGAWISGFAPIRSAEGILEIDYDLNFIEAYLFEQFLKAFAGIAGVLLLAVIGSVWLANTFSKPVQALTTAVVAIGAGDYKQRVNLKRTDEFEALGRHFNEMARALALEERMHLSKYVSQDTMTRVAAEDSHGVISGTRETIVCLFSDIRGFTAYSEQHPVEDVIRLLNDLLHRQTEVILAHNGNIDKFVGDEVMATFRGEHRLKNALDAAINIQRELRSDGDVLEGALQESVSIGIGINEGEVIQGDIGSVERKDFTVIGSAVNLAARLCSAADGGQILVTGDLAARLGAVYRTQSHGAVQFKGIDGPSAVFSVTPAHP